MTPTTILPQRRNPSPKPRPGNTILTIIIQSQSQRTILHATTIIITQILSLCTIQMWPLHIRFPPMEGAKPPREDPSPSPKHQRAEAASPEDVDMALYGGDQGLSFRTMYIPTEDLYLSRQAIPPIPPLIPPRRPLHPTAETLGQHGINPVRHVVLY